MSARSAVGAVFYYGGQLAGEWVGGWLARKESDHARKTRLYNSANPAPGERHGSSWVARRKDQP